MPPAEMDQLPAFRLDPEPAVPAQEELVLIVRVPGELTLQLGDADDRLVDRDEIARLPGTGQARDRLGDRNRPRLHPLEAYGVRYHAGSTAV